MAFTAAGLEEKKASDQVTEDRALWTKYVNIVTAEDAEISCFYGRQAYEAIHDEPVGDCSAKPWRVFEFESVVRSRREAHFFERVWRRFHYEKNWTAYRKARAWDAAAAAAAAAPN